MLLQLNTNRICLKYDKETPQKPSIIHKTKKNPPVFISYVHPDRNLAPMIKPQKEKENKEIRTINKRGTITGREGEQRGGEQRRIKA